MRRTFKIALAIAAIPCLAFAAPSLQIGVCRNFDNLSENDIKMVAEGVFLDSEGNQVEPCKHGDSIFFPIVQQVKNGKRIYDASKARAMHQEPVNPPAPSRQEPAPPAEQDPAPPEQRTSDGVPVTYGDGNYEVQDVNDFRAQVRREEIKAATTPRGEYSIPIDDIRREVNIPSDIKLSMTLSKLIRAEKMAKLESDYHEITERVRQIYQPTVRDRMSSIVDTLVAKNRLFLANSQNAVVNQYGIQPGDVNGAAYVVFNAKMSAADFLRGFMELTTDVATNGNDNLDTRLAIMEFLYEQTPEILAGRYSARETIAVEKLYGDPASLNAEGYRLYNMADENRRQLFAEALSRANEEIMNREYESLPDMITKKQYNALSSIDKYKYAPVMSGNYVDHSKYKKRPREKVVNVAMPQK